MNKKTIRDIDLRGKRVLVRVDLNVPVSENPQGSVSVTDTTRMERIVPTINEISENGTFLF